MSEELDRLSRVRLDLYYHEPGEEYARLVEILLDLVEALSENEAAR